MGLIFIFILNWHDQPKLVAKICAHPLPLLDIVVTNNVSLYTLCDDHLYWNWQTA